MVDLVRLPDSVERGARGGPVFNTTVVTLSAGREGRNQEWQVARHSWNVGYGVTGRDDFETVRAFFYACAGRARSFLFKDWADYKGSLEAMAVVSGEPTQRRLAKTYSNGLSSYVRLIDHPVAGTLHVFVDTLEVSNYTVNGGLLTFTADPGANVVATFEFDIPVRFDTDQFDATIDTPYAMEVPNIPIIEVTDDE